MSTTNTTNAAAAAASTASSATITTLPTDVFERLLPALVDVVSAINNEDQTVLAHKQAVAAATEVFRQRVATAREVVENIPGGEMSIRDQDEVIAMLKALRDQKRRQLEEFAKYRTNAAPANTNPPQDEPMDDSA